MSKRDTKLMVIGLDGATYSLILPWIKDGALPVFEKLLDESAWAPLESTRPPLTSPAWPVFYTGRNPGKLGIVDFLKGRAANRIVSYTDIEGLPFWDVAASHGMRSLVINVPITYPPHVVNGFMISGMLTPPERPFYTSREVMDDILTHVGNYIVDLDILTLGSFDRRRSLQRLYHMMEQRYKTAMYLKKNQPHDIMVVVFQAVDIVCHRLWSDPRQVQKVYKLMDGFIGELSKDVEFLLIMSDHGFAGYERGVRVNQFLLERGDLVPKKASYDTGFTRGSSEILKQRFDSQLDKGLSRVRCFNKWFWHLGISRSLIKTILGNGRSLRIVKKLAPAIFKKMIPPARFTVDVEKSAAYLHSCRTRSICINQSLLPPHLSYESYKRKLIDDLLSLRDNETGEKVISSVYQRKELYEGPYVEFFPDLFLEAAPNYLIRGDLGSSVIDVFSETKSAHDQDGIFLCKGPQIRSGFYSKRIKIQDLAPTILYLLGLPIPKYMDGQVHTGLTNGPDVRHEDSDFSVERVHAGMSFEEEKVIIDKLKALGYID